MVEVLPPQAPMEEVRERGLTHIFEVLYATQHEMKESEGNNAIFEWDSMSGLRIDNEERL